MEWRKLNDKSGSSQSLESLENLVGAEGSRSGGESLLFSPTPTPLHPYSLPSQDSLDFFKPIDDGAQFVRHGYGAQGLRVNADIQ